MGVTSFDKARAIKRKFMREYLRNISAACGLTERNGFYHLSVRLQKELPANVKLPSIYEEMEVSVKFIGEVKP